MAEHFVHPPNWTWYITFYFFLAGLAGGSYVLATIVRIWGAPGDEPLARLAFRLGLPLIVICAILLTIDLGRPLSFWHMLVNTTPGALGPNLKLWSPMSVGVWMLLIFGFFSLLSFCDGMGWIARLPNAVLAVGSLFGLFLASYTGVLLSVSNQPLWSDTYALGGLFLASALSGSAALLAWLGAKTADLTTQERLGRADRYFAVLELLFILAFFLTVWSAGTIAHTLSGIWLVLWVLVIASLIPPLGFGFARRGATAMPILVLTGVLLMRIAVVFSAQY